MLISILCLLHAALAGPAVRKDAEGLMGSGDTVEFTVLDVNARFAALRQVYTDNDEEYRPISCRYPGLREHPKAGVELALLDLQSGAVTSFHVYKTAHDGGHTDNPKPCTTTAEAKRQLAAAKAAFREAGLDPERRPQPAIAYEIERGPQGSPVLPSVVPVGVDLHEDGYETAVYSLDFYWKEHPLEVRYTERKEFMGTAIAELADDEQVFYRATREFHRMLAGAGDVSFPQAYKSPAGLVFLEVFHSFTAMRDSGHFYQYGMTPPIPELSPWVEIAFDLQPDHITVPQPQQITLLVGEPGAERTRFDLGSVDGICTPYASTTPNSLSISCGADSHTDSSTSIHVKQEGDLLVVDHYRSDERDEEGKARAVRLLEVPIPPKAHIRTLLGREVSP